MVTVRMGVREYLDFLEVERGLAANSVESYWRDLRRYEEVLAKRGRADLDQVTTADVAEFLASLREGDGEHDPLAVSSAARALVAVRGMHAFLVTQGLADSDPARELAPPAPPKRLPKAIPLADVERLLEATGAGDDSRSLRDRALLEFLYGTGARISEATGLDVDELQLDDDPVVRLVGKGGKHRIVPVGSYAVSALDAYLIRARPALAAASKRTAVVPAVFLNARGGRLTRQGAWGILQATAETRRPGRRVTAHAAALVRHPPARRRRRHPGSPGAARARVGVHHPDLHVDHR